MEKNWGYRLLGLCSVLFGAITIPAHEWGGITFHGGVPGAVVPYAAAVAYVAAGVLIQFPRAIRFASALMAIAFALSALLYVYALVVRFAEPGIWDGLFERLGIFAGAFIVFERTRSAPDARLLRSAMMLFGVCVISYTMAQVLFLNATASLVPKWIPPSQMSWAILTTVAFALAAVALLIDRAALLAMQLLTVMILIFGFTIWVPAAIAKPGSLFVWSEFTWNFAIAATAWIVAEWLRARAPTRATTVAT